MNKKNFDEKMTNLVFFTIVALLIFISFLIAKPFIIPLISGALLAFIFYPVYNLLLKKFKKKNLTALVTVFIIIIFIAFPVFIMGNVLTKEVSDLFSSMNAKIRSGEFIPEDCEEETFLCRTTEKINDALSNPETKTHISNFSSKALGFFAERIGEFVLSVPKLIISFAITFFVLFYFLRDGAVFLSFLKKVSPISKTNQDYLFFQLKNTVNALIFGTLVIAVIQGTLIMLAFFIFNVANPVFWGIIAVFFSILPIIGPWIIWFPASAYLIISGYVGQENSMIWKGIGLAIFGLLIISTIDNLLRPIIVGAKAKIHPIIILLGVLGGVITFGLIGIILGPLILATFQQIIEMYAKEKVEIAQGLLKKNIKKKRGKK
jgi:predicted PurR-regulated permease PerM